MLAHGWSASSWQVLNPGIEHWIDPRGDALVGYAVHGRFAVVAGAPVCSPDRQQSVQQEFERQGRAAGRTVCWFGVEEPFAAKAAALPRHSRLLLGAQPWWDPARWEQLVAGHPSLRAQLRRARNKAVQVDEWPAEQAARRRVELEGCMTHWLGTRGMPPMRFLVEHDTLGCLDNRRLFVACRGDEVLGFLVASPVPRRGGWLIEQVVRGRGAVNGTSESLVHAAMQAFAAEGCAYATLGMSPLSRRAGEGSAPMPAWLRLVFGWVRAHGRRFYNFEGLDRFKAKLGPAGWEPLYAVVDAPAPSPALLRAIAGVFTGTSPELAFVRAMAWALGKEARRVRALARRPRPVSLDRRRRSR